ncbi:MAG: hypothetical protein JJLCMIEE_00027 [Acidimicrobiales bacterium]|nr:MAG: hypothetical protein EDR02_00410 [Actinomycetota bacterium]MBV6506990.1 hypothetical protein [Acidimicrobiales bacterium]RIK05802.1 MAG: hypothetical protein DCC48_09035 [Acidobacteriota bacterium]
MPKDQWKFIPSDDELGEDADDEGPEAAAVHVEAEHDSTRAEDPGRSDVQLGDRGTDDWEDTPVRYLEDEQPEFGADGESSDSDTEEDLEEILEEQHYAFESQDEES